MGMFRHLRAWTRRSRLDDELRDELAQHVEWTTERLMAEGLPQAEARRRAAVATGNVTTLRERSRDIWGFPSLDSVIQDARYGVRQMRRAPLFTFVAVLSLAIGIGASAAVFSLADAMLFTKLPVPKPDQLVLLRWSSGPRAPFSSLNGNGERNAEGLASTSFSKAAFQEMQRVVSAKMTLAGFADLYDVSVSVDGRAELANANVVSGNYFETLRVSAAAGRTLGPADDTPGAPGAAVISHGFWRKRFGGAGDTIGRSINVNGIPFTIVGITAPGFRGTGQVVDAVDVFLPFSARPQIVRGDEPVDDPAFWWVLMVGRLRDGITAADVKGSLDLVLKQVTAASRPDFRAGELPALAVLDGSRGQHETRDSFRDPLKTMAVVVMIVLLVACANVANLLLARGQARSRELSVRAAIGAPRSRVIRQLVTEGILLAALGSMCGLVAATWISRALMPALTTSPGAAQPALNIKLFAFVGVLAAGCAVFFALTPAIRSTRLTLTAGLRDASTRTTGHGRSRLAGSLVVLQLALSMMLVVTAALLARSLRNLDRAELGFDVRNVLMFKVDPTLNGYAPDRVRDVATRIAERLRTLPGVAGVTYTSHALLSHQSSIGVATRESETAPALGSAEASAFMENHLAWRQVTGPDFFATLRIPIVRGRALDGGDSAKAQPVMVINRLLARQLFDSEDVVGRRVRLGMQKSSPVYEIVGLVADARYTAIRERMPPTAYLAAAQQPLRTVVFEVRTSADAGAIGTAVREAVRAIDDQLPIVNMRTLEQQVAESLRQERLFARLAVLLGAVTLALSAIGLYGLLAYGVAQRVPEIGLRMALGAERASVGWMVLRQSLLLAAAGLVAGAAGAYAGTKLIESLLYELPARDPVAIAAASVILLTACALAGYIPARRAARVDPLVALRAD